MQLVRSLDESRWREFVNKHPQSNIFHTSEMFHVFERTRAFDPELWAVIDSQDEVICLFIPVMNTVLNGVLQYFSTRSVSYGSLLSSLGPESGEAISLLLRSYNSHRKSALFTELRNQSDLSDVQAPLVQNGFIYEAHLNFIFDLRYSPEEIWKNIRSNARRNIKKAERSNVSIDEVRDANQLSDAYKILENVYSRIKVPLPDFSLFEAGFEILNPRGMMKILMARLGDEPIGALALLIHQGTITYWYTGVLREYASYRAGDLLVWYSLKFGSQGGFHLFDFGGGGKPDEEYGVRDFKAKFGGELVNFGRNVKIHSPFRYQLSLLGYKVMRKFL